MSLTNEQKTVEAIVKKASENSALTQNLNNNPVATVENFLDDVELNEEELDFVSGGTETDPPPGMQGIIDPATGLALAK